MGTLLSLSPLAIASAFVAVLALALLVGGVILLLRPGSVIRTGVGLAGVTVGAVILLFAGAGVVWAGDAVPPASTSIDLTPLVQVLTAAAAGAVPVLVALVRVYLKQRLGLELDAQTRGYVQDAAERCADLVAATLKRHAEANRLSLDIHNVTVAAAANTLFQQVPDGIARLGIDRSGVERMLTVRLAARGILPPDVPGPSASQTPGA